MKTNNLILGGVVSIILALGTVGQAMALDAAEADYDLKLLGKYGFFDKISNPPRMACVTCHDPATGGTGGVSGVNLHQVAITGANPHTVGNLKPPTNAYASFIPLFNATCGHGGLGPAGGPNELCGGNFWNGRAEGNDVGSKVFPDGATKHLGDEVFFKSDGTLLAVDYSNYFGPTADQALNPMPNKVEQNIERKLVCEHVKSAKYAKLYELAWGVPVDCSDTVVVEHAGDVAEERAFDISFKRYILAICAWQHSKELNSFSSKRDKALQRELDAIDVDATPGKFPLVGFTAQENYGHDLFYATRFSRIPVGKLGAGKFSNCAFCHADNPVLPGRPKDDGSEPLQLYSAQDYHNIGTPRNLEIPATYDSDGNFIDPDVGVAGHAVNALGNTQYPEGFFKTPTLRNVYKRPGNGFTKAFTHNGWFKSVESIVHYYNTAFVFTAGCTDVQAPIGQCDDDAAATPNPTSTAATFGVTRCPANITTAKDALAHNCWPAPARPNGAIPFLVGDLHLTAADEAAIVAYLKTFTDTETVKAPPPYNAKK